VIRIFIAENDDELRVSMSLLIQSQAEMKLQGWSKTGAEAIELISRFRPDIALIDCVLPDASGFEVSRRLNLEAPGVRRVMLTSVAAPESFNEALTASVSGLVFKSNIEEQLLNAIREVHQRGFFWDADVLNAMSKG
jgi:two-component system response regulator DesR